MSTFHTIISIAQERIFTKITFKVRQNSILMLPIIKPNSERLDNLNQ
jgi:hypothetical protein